MGYISKQFALVFFVGFLILVTAIAFGLMRGEFFSGIQSLVALRYLGFGMMLAGLVLWIALVRAEAGKAGLEPLLILLTTLGIAALCINVGFDTAGYFMAFALGGGALIGAALVIGILAMIIAPARLQPLHTSWPEGGDQSSTDQMHDTH